MLLTTCKCDKNSQVHRHDENAVCRKTVEKKELKRVNIEHSPSFKIKASYNLTDNHL